MRLSLTVRNLTDQFNPLEVHSNLADPRYGRFFGNYDRKFLVVGRQHGRALVFPFYNQTRRDLREPCDVGLRDLAQASSLSTLIRKYSDVFIAWRLTETIN